MFFFFFQAEDGIRDDLVTGVQTCALPIATHVPDLVAHSRWPLRLLDRMGLLRRVRNPRALAEGARGLLSDGVRARQAGQATRRERVCGDGRRRGGQAEGPPRRFETRAGD